MDHNDEYKRPETNYKIIRVLQDKERAYKRAHYKQLEYVRSEKDYLGVTYHRDANDESWEVSYGKLIEFFDKNLPKPEFTMMACQTRYLVEEHVVVDTASAPPQDSGLFHRALLFHFRCLFLFLCLIIAFTLRQGS